MPLPIDEYALVGDLHTAALVGADGSIDWLPMPRFDSAACFAALLGEAEHGRFRIAPRGRASTRRRRYRPGTLILETDFEAEGGGAVRLIDFMRAGDGPSHLVRIIEGLKGEVPLEVELAPRFGYGDVTPWITLRDQRTADLIGGPDAVVLRSDTPLARDGARVRAAPTVAAGERVAFSLSWYPSHLREPESASPAESLERTERFWRAWSDRCRTPGRYRDEVVRSLITLKALTYAPTGAIVAAPTTSLPEQPGGVRNWDYRFCWLRDATFTLYALLNAGYVDEARAWRDWLLRAAAGQPDRLQILYGLHGERRLPELELDWLPGYQGARPVRVGNAAAGQLQLDVYGEVMDCLHLARRQGVAGEAHAWDLQRAVLGSLEGCWREPDKGIWEVRGPERHFTHSRVMAWVAFDRAIKAVESFGLEGPVDRWRQIRRVIREEVLQRGFDASRGTFTQAYGEPQLDAALLLIPLVGFLPPDDARVRGTLAAIERELLHDGLVRRYESGEEIDGLPPGEGVFLPCSFWLVDNLALVGRQADAEALFERLLGLANDVGLLSEEYDPVERRLLGNFPQAFTHIALVNSARNLEPGGGPSRHRSR